MLVAWYPLNGNLKDISGNHYDLNTNYLYGDVNQDGSITEADSQLILNYAAHSTTLTNDQLKLADVNKDGKADVLDSRAILKYIEGTGAETLVGKPSNIQRFEPVWGEGKTGRYAWKNTSQQSYTNRIFIDELRNARQLSVSCWVKVDSIPTNFKNILNFHTRNNSNNSSGILRLESVGVNGTWINWYDNNHLGTTNAVIANQAELGKWVHIVNVFERDKCHKYINGKYIAYSNYTNFKLDFDEITLVGDFWIGNEGNETSYFDGSICNVKIYDHCLSKEEAYQDYLSPMLHYTFEQPYAEETENISHTVNKVVDYSNISYGTDDKGDYFIKTPSGVQESDWCAGPKLMNNTVYGGNYYTWSIEINPDQDLSPFVLMNEIGTGIKGYFDRNINPTSTWISNDAGCKIIDTYRNNIPKNTWTRVWLTVYIEQTIGKASLLHRFSPRCPSEFSQIKVYYRNSMLEKKDHMTPYTRDRREQQLIRDTSGQGNDGTVKYMRERITINDSIYSNGCRVTKSGQNTFTIDNFSNNTDTNTRFNVVANLYRIPKNNKYHYINSTVSYEFDIKLENIVIESGKTFLSSFQGITYKSDGDQWIANGPVHVVTLTQRLRNGTNGTYHVTIEKQITNSAAVGSTVTGYDIQLRFDYIQSGKIIVSNLYAYYRDLDTSTLGITDRNNVIGTHSISFKNGKERLEIPPLYNEINELSYSVWVYRHNDDSGDYHRNLFAQHSTNSGSLWLSYDTEGNGLWDYNYGNDNKYHYFRTGGVGLIEKDKWTHIVYTFKNGVNRFYINGNLRSTQDDSSNYTKIKFIGATNCIGEREITYSPQWRDGLFADISDVRLYPIELTEEEVKALYRTKAKIDKDSNMYTNQLVETKDENLIDINNIDWVGWYHMTSAPIVSHKDNILNITVNGSGDGASANGFYLRNQDYGGEPSVGKKYRYSFYVRFSRGGKWMISEEHLGGPTMNFIEGKWYYIEQQFTAKSKPNGSFCFYLFDQILQLGDTLELRDFKFYRIDDDLLPIERDTDPKITKKAQVKGFELNEIDYDRLTKRQNIIEKDGAKWVEVFYHNTNNNTVWFTDEAEALHCTSQYKYSRLDCLEQYRQSDGKFEFLLEYPIEHPGKFNRWKQTDNPTKVLENNVSETAIDTNGFESIHLDFDTNFGGLIKHKDSGYPTVYRTFLDGVTNSYKWYYSIGCYDNNSSNSDPGWIWIHKMPGPYFGNSGLSAVTEVRLYARISDEQIKLGPTIINKYGAQWLEVFYHNNHSGTVLFTDKEEAMHTIGNKDKYSILDCLEQYREKDNKFEFLLEYPTDLPNEYLRWKQTNNPLEDNTQITEKYSSNEFVKGYELIHDSWGDKIQWSGLLLNQRDDLSLIDGVIGTNYWYAIGCYANYNNTGIPGVKLGGTSDRVIANDTHLYVRIDNINNRQQIAKLLKTGIIKTKEIKEV